MRNEDGRIASGLKWLLTIFGGLIVTGLIAAGGAHERLNGAVERVGKIETEQADLRRAIASQAETNGRIDERTVRILDEVAAMRRQMRVGQ